MNLPEAMQALAYCLDELAETHPHVHVCDVEGVMLTDDDGSCVHVSVLLTNGRLWRFAVSLPDCTPRSPDTVLAIERTFMEVIRMRKRLHVRLVTVTEHE